MNAPVANHEETENLELALRPGAIHCASCVSTIESALEGVPGVEEAAVNMATERIAVEIDPGLVDVGAVRGAVSDAGYELLDGDLVADQASQAESEARQAEIDDLKQRVILGAVLT